MSRENCESGIPDNTNKKSTSEKISYELIEQKTGLKQYANEGLKRPRTGFWGMLQDLSQLIRLENQAKGEQGGQEYQKILDKKLGLTRLPLTDKKPTKLPQYIEPVLPKDC